MSKLGVLWGGPHRLALLLLASMLLLILGASPAKAAAFCDTTNEIGILGVFENSTSAKVDWAGSEPLCKRTHYNVVWAGGGGRLQREAPISASSSTWIGGRIRGTVYTVSVQPCTSRFAASSKCGPWVSKRFVACGTRGVPCGHPRLNAPPPMNIVSGADLCLDVHAPDQFKNGARVQVWTCNGSNQQTWVMDEGVKAIISLAGKCLDVHARDRLLDGGKVQVWDCNRQPQQQWVHDTRLNELPSPGGNSKTRPIRNVGAKCLDVHARDQLDDGARVQVWACNDTMQQDWRIVEAR